MGGLYFALSQSEGLRLSPKGVREGACIFYIVYIYVYILTITIHNYQYSPKHDRGRNMTTLNNNLKQHNRTNPHHLLIPVSATDVSRNDSVKFPFSHYNLTSEFRSAATVAVNTALNFII